MLQRLFPKHLPHHFLVGVGSNIEPYKNIGSALKELLVLSSTFAISPIVQTEPVGMKSEHKFLNFVIYFPSNLRPDRLKQHFNVIETKFGRDRNDPMCKVKDRPIDLDIITEVNTEVNQETNWSKVIEISEGYYHLPMLALLQALSILPKSTPPLIEAINIDFANTKIGQESMLIEKHKGDSVCSTVMF